MTQNITDQADSPNELVYTDIDSVERRLDRTLDEDGHPMAQEAIRSAQEEIDSFTNHAWRPRRRVERREANLKREPNVGIPLTLERMNVRDIKSVKINVGREDLDLVEDDSFTEGRTKDYWVERIDGTLYIRSVFRRRPEFARVEYTYGSEGEVPPDIKQACSLLAAAYMIDDEGGSFMLPEGGEGVDISNRPDKYREQARQILERHQRMVPIV